MKDVINKIKKGLESYLDLLALTNAMIPTGTIPIRS